MTLKSYKEKQFLVFEFEDGKNVKYNLATGETIGKSGKIVKNINSQLSGYDLLSVINSFEDEKYKIFLLFLDSKIINKSDRYNYRVDKIKNIGSFLSRIYKYNHIEQFFSAGLTYLDANVYIKFKVSDISKGLIKFCKDYAVELDEQLIESYSKNPNDFNFYFSLKFNTISKSRLLGLFKNVYYTYSSDKRSFDKKSFDILIEEYNYNPQSLLFYVDNLMTYEGIEDFSYILRELCDYNKMLKSISTRKYEKYPKYFLSMHKIVVRNYNRLKLEFPVEDFKERIDKELEYKYRDYVFLYPNSPQDIKDEAVSAQNCVASYIEKVLKGECHIMFLRKKDTPEKTLVTLELQKLRVIQAQRSFTKPVSDEEQNAINHFNKYLAKIHQKRLSKSQEAKKINSIIISKTKKLKNKKLEAIPAS